MTMSDYGFHRTPSPAMRRVTRLKNLRIEEVSSCDSGAGYGVKVLIRKGDNMTQNTAFESICKSLPGLTADLVAKRLNADWISGKISNAEYAQHQQSLARSLHGNSKNPLADFLASPVGSAMVNDACRKRFETTMRATSHGDAADYLKNYSDTAGDEIEDGENLDQVNADGVSQSRYDAEARGPRSPNRRNNTGRSRAVSHSHQNEEAPVGALSSHTLNPPGNRGPYSKFTAAVKRVEKKYGLGFDAACTKLIREQQRGW
jgi:hypothetical protein